MPGSLNGKDIISRCLDTAVTLGVYEGPRWRAPPQVPLCFLQCRPDPLGGTPKAWLSLDFLTIPVLIHSRAWTTGRCLETSQMQN